MVASRPWNRRQRPSATKPPVPPQPTTVIQGLSEQERVVQVGKAFDHLLVSVLGCIRPFVHQPDARRRAVEYLRPLHRGEVAVDADPQAELRPVAVEASYDSVDAKSLLVTVVGLREEGTRGSVRVELGNHARRGLVGEGRGRPFLRGNNRQIGATVPLDGEEPLGVRIFLEPPQPDLEEPGRDGAVGKLHLLSHGSEPPHLAGGDERPRRQLRALGLDVDASRSENVIVAYPLNAGEPGGVGSRGSPPGVLVR